MDDGVDYSDSDIDDLIAHGLADPPLSLAERLNSVNLLFADNFSQSLAFFLGQICLDSVEPATGATLSADEVEDRARDGSASWQKKRPARESDSDSEADSEDAVLQWLLRNWDEIFGSPDIFDHDKFDECWGAVHEEAIRSRRGGQPLKK